MVVPNIVEVIESAHALGEQRQLLRETLETLEPGHRRLVIMHGDRLERMGEVLDGMGVEWWYSDGMQYGFERTAKLSADRELIMGDGTERPLIGTEPINPPPPPCALCQLEIEGRSWNKMHFICAFTDWLLGNGMCTGIFRVMLIVLPVSIFLTWLLTQLGWIGN